MTSEQRQELARLLKAGEEISPEWARLLFPPEKREYELVYYGKEREEDIIADTLAVPLQPVRTFGRNGIDWDNKLVFGDNLQVMKTLLEMKKGGRLSSADGTSGIKLVYIDPPFATKQDFRGTEDQKAYQDKLTGAVFIEFLRKRLVLLRELLSDDGTIYIHMDFRKAHYIKTIMELNEGWDVKNVFQIVPHEERAFNSKLLIAQVLGRGLRRPDGWMGPEPVVTVFNHDAWAGRIRHLVDEILEMENRITASVISESPYHFDLHNLDYTRETDTSNFTKKGEYRLLEEGFVDLPDQVEVEDVAIDFEQAVTGDRVRFKTKLEHKTYSFEDVAEELYRRLQSIDEESKDAEDKKDRTEYAKKFPRERCLEIVKASAKRARIKSGKITEENRQKILQALGPLYRKSAKRVVYKLTPNTLVKLNTRGRQQISVGAAELRRGDRTVFFTPDSVKTIPDDQLEFFDAIKDPDGDYRAGSDTVTNSHDFKTPCNLAIADATPERKFIRSLCTRENALVIDGWLKNAPQRFYAIEYAWKKGEHPKRGEFSPDFFVHKGKIIFVIEIKDDSEISEPAEENKKKSEYARDHFERLNKWLKKEGVDVAYQLNFMTPKDFNKFFTKLKSGDALGFRSELDVVLNRG